MKKTLAILAVPFVLVLSQACGGQAAACLPAQDAAQAWLALTDSRQYQASWEGAAAFFKASVSCAGWESAATSVRAPLGALVSRKLKSATFTRSLPGAPAGEYVVILYETRFENRSSAIETVTPMHEADGSWKVSGYFIR